MKKITFNKVIFSLFVVTYLITIVYMILAFPKYGCNNTNEYLPYAIFFGVFIPLLLAAIWLVKQVMIGKFDK